MENNVTASEQAQSEQEIHINEIIRPYARKWPWFIIGALIALVLAYFYLKTTTPVYKVQSTVLIKDSKASGSATGEMGVLKDLSGLGGMGTNSVDNEIEIFKSKKLMRNVVASKGLQTDIVSDEGLSEREIYGDTSPITVRIINEKKNAAFPEEPVAIQKEEVEVFFDLLLSLNPSEHFL
jgi:tyrosine-protein kinase Etk/Wzc